MKLSSLLYIISNPDKYTGKDQCWAMKQLQRQLDLSVEEILELVA